MILAVSPEADRFQRLAGVLLQPRLHPVQPGFRIVPCRPPAPRQVEPDSHVLSSPGGPSPPGGLSSAMTSGPCPRHARDVSSRPIAAEFDGLLHAGEANIVLLPVLGEHSLLLLDEPQHMAQRKLMLPSFHGERMLGYEQVMADVAAEEIERWPLGEPYAVRPAMQRITLEVIMRTVFGVQDGLRPGLQPP